MSLPPALVAALSARFEWLRPLGEGANGWVGLARERALGREVALKVGKRQGDATQLGRFAREAQIAAGLKHPNAVSVHSTGVVEGHPYLVLDYVEGAQTLGDACRGAPLSSCLGYLLDVTRAMALAHSQGVVHRDLKPDNVLVDPAGVARVTDFGCASLRGADRLTQSGAAIGTPHYMPPEQFGERERVGPHSDVWSLGVMLYELGCGRRPFEGDSMTELAGQIAVGVQRCELLPDAPEGLAKVILRCLASRPGARYPHAGALLTDLEHALSARAGAGGPPPWALGALLLTLLGACAALTLWAVGVVGDPGGVAPPAAPSRPLAPDPVDSSDQARWALAQQARSAADFLDAGEAWLEAFPESPLRGEVAAALERRRLAEPRWIFANAGARKPQLATNRDSLLVLFEATDGAWLHAGPWSGAPRTVYPLRGKSPWRLGASAGGPGLWLLGVHPRVGLSATYVAQLPPAGQEIGLSTLQLEQSVRGFAVSPDGRRCAVLYPERWVCYDAGDDGGVGSTIMGAAPPASLGRMLSFDASGEQLLFVQRPPEVTGSFTAVRLATQEARQTSVPFVAHTVLTTPEGETLVTNGDGQLVLYDAQFDHVANLENPEVEEKFLIGRRATAGALERLACSPAGVVYGIAEGEFGCRLQAWDLDARSLLREQSLGQLLELCVSPDGRYLALVKREQVEVWDRWVSGEWQPKE